MKIELRHRHYGMHELIKTIEIDGNFNDYCTLVKNSDYSINEQKLIDSFPQGFLPVEPKYILVTVDEGKWGTAQTGLKLFRNWAKYFDSYVIDLIKE